MKRFVVYEPGLRDKINELRQINNFIVNTVIKEEGTDSSRVTENDKSLSVVCSC
jgi:hypothetical protein